jgi:hypothetical protein
MGKGGRPLTEKSPQLETRALGDNTNTSVKKYTAIKITKVQPPVKEASISQELLAIEVLMIRERISDLVTEDILSRKRFNNRNTFTATHTKESVRNEGSIRYNMYNNGTLCKVRATSKINGGKKMTEEWYHLENGKPPSFAINTTRKNIGINKVARLRRSIKMLISKAIDNILCVIKYLTTP